MAAIRTVTVALLLACSVVYADDERARFNYQLHCQGCHLPDARGFPGKVPRMTDFVGYFLHSQAGREFLVRVPGVAGSQLSDAEIAEVMNWLLRTFSEGQLPDQYLPFTESEVSQLRAEQETDPEARRAEILAEIAADLPALATELANGS